MIHIDAQFKRPWQPGRWHLVALGMLGFGALAAVGADVWLQQRLAALRVKVAQLSDADRGVALPAAPRPPAAYDTSARQFLSERSAPWAPMLRTLESGAMIGVTPSAVEFNAADGVARVTLNYADPAALIDYLDRINEGVSPEGSLAPWTLVETHLQSAVTPNPTIPIGAAGGMPVATGAQSVAIIRSIWADTLPVSSSLGHERGIGR